jgi:hypothetical protein
LFIFNFTLNYKPVLLFYRLENPAPVAVSPLALENPADNVYDALLPGEYSCIAYDICPGEFS